jgi:hypothetical protein
VAVFPKGSTIFAVPSKFDGALVTRPDGSMPLGKLGEILVKVVEPKIKMIEESTANTGKKDYMKWIYLGGAGILLWWYLTKDNKKKEI